MITINLIRKPTHKAILRLVTKKSSFKTQTNLLGSFNIATINVFDSTGWFLCSFKLGNVSNVGRYLHHGLVLDVWLKKNLFRSEV